MQRTVTELDRRFSEGLTTGHHRHRVHSSNRNLTSLRDLQRRRNLYDLHYAHLHHYYRFHTAYCSFIVSHLHQRAPRTFRATAAQSSHTLCTSRNTVAPELPVLQRPTNPRARNGGCKAISVRLRPPRLSHIPLPSMQRQPPTDRSSQDIRAIISNAVPPHVAVSALQLLPQHRLQQVYEVKLSDMTTMLVALPPPPHLRLLRSEQSMDRSEAVVVRWLREELQPPTAKEQRASGSVISEKATSETTKIAAMSIATDDKIFDKSLRTASTPIALRANLLRYLPSPVTLTSASPTLVDTPMPVIPSSTLSLNVFRPTPGTPIAALSSPLTAAERSSVEYQAGQLLRRLSQVTPKSRNFGPALTVISQQSLLGTAHSSGLAVSMGSWSVAFHSILESILRDGEDVAVALAYPTVRKHFRRLGHLLDAVTVPSLVVVDCLDDTNLLVQRSPTRPPTQNTADPGTDASALASVKQRSASPTSPAIQEKASDTQTQEKRIDSPVREVRASSSPPFVEPAADIVVTGLRDWSHCIFGDPLFASVFAEQPTSPFLNGYNSVGVEGRPGPRGSLLDHEDTESRAVRLLFYQCYHSVVQIVRGFYRPGRDQTVKELAARKRLTEILAKLEAIEDDPKQRLQHRRPSGELSPAKKARSESGDDTQR